MTKPLENCSGFLIIDKPTGCTSFDIIKMLRRKTKVKRIGHTGTLDPFATGLMICCLGSYTRLASMIENLDKTYIARIKLGEKTDTGDRDGNVIVTDTFVPFIDSVHDLKSKVLQIQELVVPFYSAVKIDGKRAYTYARKNQKISLPSRAITVYEFDVLSYSYPYLEYRCRVSKGTYIRSISEWIATELGTVGHTYDLKRTAIGKIKLDQTVSIDEIDDTNWQHKLADPSLIFPESAMITLQDSKIALLRCGQAIQVSEAMENKNILVIDKDRMIRSVCVYTQGTLKPRINLV